MPVIPKSYPPNFAAAAARSGLPARSSFPRLATQSSVYLYAGAKYCSTTWLSHSPTAGVAAPAGSEIEISLRVPPCTIWLRWGVLSRNSGQVFGITDAPGAVPRVLTRQRDPDHTGTRCSSADWHFSDMHSTTTYADSGHLRVDPVSAGDFWAWRSSTVYLYTVGGVELFAAHFDFLREKTVT